MRLSEYNDFIPVDPIDASNATKLSERKLESIERRKQGQPTGRSSGYIGVYAASYRPSGDRYLLERIAVLYTVVPGIFPEKPSQEDKSSELY